MSGHHQFKRSKLDESEECSGKFQTLDKDVNEDDGIEMPTLHLENPSSVEQGEDEDNADEEIEMPTLEVIQNDEEEDGVEIPSLVVEIFLDWTKDVKLLKTCRLVNKYWDSLACSSLQINSIAKFDCRNSQRLQELIKFQESISSRDWSLRPIPFKIIHMFTDERVNESFLKLAKIPNTTVTSIICYSHYPPDISCSERLNQLLKATMKHLTHLTIRFRCIYFPYIFQDVQLLALQSLFIACIHLFVKPRRRNCLEPLNSALENSRLTALTVLSNEYIRAYCLPSLLNINLSSIVKLSLRDDQKYNVWNLLPKLLQLPTLKIFSFQSFETPNECKEKELNVFLSSVASTVNELTLWWSEVEPDCSLIFSGLVFPQIKFLSVPCPNDTSSFVTRERFPSLKSLSLHVTKIHQMEFISDGSDSLSTVRKVSVRIDVGYQHFPSTMFLSLMSNLANEFPDTESLEIVTDSHWLSFSLLDISRAYPNLKFLRINSCRRGLFLHGTGKIDDKTYEYMRFETEGLEQPTSIDTSCLDFKKLKYLDLCGIEILTEAFQRCFPRMTALEYLAFTYQPGPSVNVMADSLKHVRRIKISTESRYSQNVIELQTALPGCEIIVI